jgi:hypothetical protein
MFTLILFFFSFLILAEPQFSNQQIDQFVTDIKKQKKIPDLAIDHLFEFYKKNRASTGGLKDVSCIEQKSYTIRWQDGKMTKPYLKSGIENESCLCVMDYTKPKDQERGHCIFLEANKPPTIESFLVAHGKGSKEVEGKPMTHTNSLRPTGTTLTGLFITAKETYRFQGEALGQYTSTGLGLYGVEKRNWTAAPVGKVTHGAPYVVDDPKKKNVGNSLGCPAMPMEVAKKILPRCKGKAAWLNFTEEIKNNLELKPQSCIDSKIP